MLHSLKSKRHLAHDKEKRLKKASSTAVNGLQTTLSISKDVTALAGLQLGISSLLDVIKKTTLDAEDVEKLANQIEGLNTFLSNTKIGRTFPPAVANRIHHLGSVLSDVSEETKATASHGLMKRLIHHGGDIQSISGHIQTITRAIQSFTVESMLAIEFALDEHANRIQENIDRLHETTRSSFQNVNTRLEEKDGNPPCALFAAFDCNADRTRCYQGTRSDLLDQIIHWIEFEDGLHDVPGASTVAPVSSRIFWINGSTGTGKTTIAYTVAEECRKRGILGASFFCSRDDDECSNPRLIFCTIAYQLGIFSPLFKAEVSRVVMSNPGIGYASIPYQLEQLIVNPLRSLARSSPSCVVVVDALDECRYSRTTSLILSSLSRFVDELSPIKFLVTSRPESHMTTVFKERRISSASQKLVLHEVRLDAVEADIIRYLSGLRISQDIQRSWPTMEDIRKFATLSHGLFIFAATLVRFIKDWDYVNARGQHQSLLSNTPSESGDSSPHFYLYGLYTQVLDRAFPSISPATSGRLKMVLGSITLLHQPLSHFALERLLGFKSSTVQKTLTNLHSVVTIPDDDTRAIRLHHPSFFDFITSPRRCQNPKFVVNPEIQHTLLARRCFQVMRGLRQDICRIEDPSILNSQVDDLSTRIDSNISSHVQYACRHWASHFANALFSDVLIDLVKEFCAERILNWLEVCSLLGELRNALLALNTAQKTIIKSSWNIPDTLSFLHDCERFTLEFFPIISSCSLQLYHSALLFTPKQALVRKTYGEQLGCTLTIYNAPDETWNPCLLEMKGHMGQVVSVAFSPDGTCIASGSHDKTVRLWDAVSGSRLATLSGDSERVTSVAFSRDGTRIVSGSDDSALRLWDAVNGTHLASLPGDSEGITSVAFSPDGTHIVSGSRDKTLCMWNAISGAHLATLRGHSGRITSVAFSPDGIHIVSGSEDKTLRLWDAVSSAHLVTLRGHSDPITSVSFSPDGTCIVSGSEDKTLRLWDAVGGAHLTTLSGHSAPVTSVAFSADGTRIVSVSDKTLRLWDADSGTPLTTFNAPWVISVAFSPDGTRIVTGSVSNTLCLWDAVSSAHLPTPGGPLDRVASIAFSADGTRIASGSDDGSLHLWDAVSGIRLTTLTGHSWSVRCLAFSADGFRIVSGSWDKTLRLWDAISGTHLATLSGHSDRVFCAAFSPDGAYVASGSDDKTLRLWDAINGAHLVTLDGHSHQVTSVAFSADGTRIVSGSFSRDLYLWDAVSGAHLGTLSGDHSWITSIAFSSDGTRMVSGSNDTTLCVWDTASGRHLDTVPGYGMCASSLARSLSRSWTSFSQTGTIPSGSPRSIFSYLAEDGWIHSIHQNRRICWIPLSYRQYALDMTNDRAAFGLEDGRVVILHFNDADRFFRDL